MEYSPLSPEKRFSRIHGHCDTVNCLTCICGNRIDFVMQRHGVSAGDFLDENGRARQLGPSDAELLAKINTEISDIPRDGVVMIPPGVAEDHVEMVRVVPIRLRMGENHEI